MGRYEKEEFRGSLFLGLKTKQKTQGQEIIMLQRRVETKLNLLLCFPLASRVHVAEIPSG